MIINQKQKIVSALDMGLAFLFLEYAIGGAFVCLRLRALLGVFNITGVQGFAMCTSS